MILLRGLEKRIETAERRLQTRHASLCRQVVTKRDTLRRAAIRPRVLAGALVAGFVFDRLRPRWKTLYSAGGLALTLYRFEGAMRSMFGALRGLAGGAPPMAETTGRASDIAPAAEPPP